ncbi:HAD family hydrolase [Actinotalea subterranea]|uniref:HAD family hydrolase n=1 Tax=Actinotalea subterranea TaxID=2607497 RepID=UPI0011EFF466|nr:HAD-IA family hydrolase [Actinotalea subterranea]
MRWQQAEAVLFDLDGVLTPTAALHRRAWAQVLGAWFTAHGVRPGYTEDDYFEHVDGRPRLDGIRAVLASRGVTLPDGEPGDPPDAAGAATVTSLGNAKNAAFGALLAEGVAPYPGATDVLDDLARRGVPTAVVSASRNTTAVLAAAGLTERFGVVVDGVRAAAEGLPGKPSPRTFLRAAELLGVPPDRAAVVEDAVSGAAAGRAGGFGLVVGVDRGAGEDALREAGADVVVHGLTELVAAP